jgi:hypothetical protein
VAIHFSVNTPVAAGDASDLLFPPYYIVGHLRGHSRRRTLLACIYENGIL